jgi:hypothetical protein
MNDTQKKTLHEILYDGLVEPISLGELNWEVKQQNPSLTLTEWQRETLNMIRVLLGDGLIRVGDLGGEGGRFEAWDLPQDTVLQKIIDLLITHHDDRRWPFFSWFKLTEKGREVATSTEEGRRIARDVEMKKAQRRQQMEREQT